MSDLNNLIEIYERMIHEPKDVVKFDRDPYGKPTIYGEILTPQDSIQQSFFGQNLFQADEEGMKQFITNFQRIYKQYPQLDLRFANILQAIFLTTIDFFYGDEQGQRKSLYQFQRDDEGGIIGTLGRLCDFKEAGAAKCSEKAVAVHNLLMVLFRNGNLQQEVRGRVERFQPSIVFSQIQGEPHAFNMLRDSEIKKTFFFDNHYWVKNIHGGAICAIYSVTEDEYQKFLQGKKISPRLVTPGTAGVNNEKVQYGIMDDGEVERAE